MKKWILTLLFLVVSSTYAVETATWDFDELGDYTLSDSNVSEVSDSVFKLKGMELNEFQVNTETSSDQTYPKATLLANGNVLLVWASNDLTHSGTDHSSTHIAGKILSPSGVVIKEEFQINDNVENKQSEVEATLLANGNILVVWKTAYVGGTDADISHIAAKIIDATGSTIKAEFEVNTLTAGEQESPQATLLSNGNMVVTWSSKSSLGIDDSGSHISAKIIDVTGNLVTDEFLVNEKTNDNQVTPKVLNIADNKILFVWKSYDVFQSDNEKPHIAAKIIDYSNTTITAEFVVNDQTEKTQTNPSVSLLNNGNIVIVWASTDPNHTGNDDDSYHIAAKIIDADGNDIKAEFQINDETEGPQAYPDVATLSNGDMIFVWRSKDLNHNLGSDTDKAYIATKILDQNGDLVKAEFQLNDNVEDIQTSPRVTMLNERIIITWASLDPILDGGGYEIVAKVLELNGDISLSYSQDKPTAISNEQPYTSSLLTFVETLGANNKGSVKYQVSADAGVSWKYFDGTNWAAVVDETTLSTATEINDNILALDADGGSFKWKAFLISNGTQQVELDKIKITYALCGNGIVEGNEVCDDSNTANGDGCSEQCIVETGYTCDGASPTVCADIDECLDSNLNNCDSNATCTNSIGSFTCVCNDFYEGDGVSCTDIDECLTDNGGCDSNATCTNNVGSAQTCTCNEYYEGDGVSCTDIDECLTDNGGCDVNAACTNNIGLAQTCACNTGYKGDGTYCEDIDECATDKDNCNVNATCTNTVGSFTCACNDFYKGDGVTCEDINECLTDNGGCDSNATCTNNVGSAQTCACNTGYEGTGQECADIDECTTNTHNCNVNATCTNTVGSFTCACNEFYEGTGVECSDINECLTDNGLCGDSDTYECVNHIGAEATCNEIVYSGSSLTGCTYNQSSNSNPFIFLILFSLLFIFRRRKSVK